MRSFHLPSRFLEPPKRAGIFEGQAGTVNLYDGNGNGLGMAVLKVSGDWTQPEIPIYGIIELFGSRKRGRETGLQKR